MTKGASARLCECAHFFLSLFGWLAACLPACMSVRPSVSPPVCANLLRCPIVWHEDKSHRLARRHGHLAALQITLELQRASIGRPVLRVSRVSVCPTVPIAQLPASQPDGQAARLLAHWLAIESISAMAVSARVAGTAAPAEARAVAAFGLRAHDLLLLMQ